MAKIQRLRPLVLAFAGIFALGCGDKEEEERAGAGEHLDLCGEHCVYRYETAMDCSDEVMEDDLADCQSDCSTFDVSLTDTCKEVHGTFYACATDAVTYQCGSEAVAPDSSYEPCRSEFDAKQDCLDFQ
jgi:hypothetical protein